MGDSNLGAGESQTTLTSSLDTKATATTINARATATTVYTKTEAANLLNTNVSTTAWDTKAPWVHDAFLETDAIHTHMYYV
jgi:hypothetical protein